MILSGIIISALISTQAVIHLKQLSPQEQFLSLIPQPLHELLEAAKDINNHIANVGGNIFAEYLPHSSQDILKSIGDAKIFLSKVNNWFKDAIGIPLTKLFKLIGNVLAWILESLAKLIRHGVSAFD
jgi:hypothetical protein